MLIERHSFVGAALSHSGTITVRVKAQSNSRVEVLVC